MHTKQYASTDNPVLQVMIAVHRFVINIAYRAAILNHSLESAPAIMVTILMQIIICVEVIILL